MSMMKSELQDEWDKLSAQLFIAEHGKEYADENARKILKDAGIR